MAFNKGIKNAQRGKVSLSQMALRLLDILTQNNEIGPLLLQSIQKWTQSRLKART